MAAKMNMPEAVKIAKAAEEKAWKDFLIKFPNTDKSTFTAQVEITGSYTATAEIYLKAGPNRLSSIFGSDTKY